MTREESPSIHLQWPRPLKRREQINVQVALDLGDVFLNPLDIFVQKPYSLRAKTACRLRFSLKIFHDTPKHLVFRKVKEDGEHFKIHIWNQHRASFPQRIMRSQVHPRDAPHPTELPRSWSITDKQQLLFLYVAVEIKILKLSQKYVEVNTVITNRRKRQCWEGKLELYFPSKSTENFLLW